MNKIYGLILFLLSLPTILVQAQSTCETVTAELTAPNPQSGSYNYWGVRVKLSQTYHQDVTVNGLIFKEGRQYIDGWTLVITAGNLSAETNDFFYQTDPASSAEVEITSVTPCPSSGGVQLTMTSQLQSYINQKQQELNNAGNNICWQVSGIASDVSPTGNGSLSFPNYVRFVQVGESIDSLNNVWDDLYASAMNDIVAYAFSSGAATGENNEVNREKVWDIIEDNHFVIQVDKASICLEQQFNVSSLRQQIVNAEDAWLAAGNTDMTQNPALNEELPEEFWSLVGPGYAVNITDVNVANQLQNMQDQEKAKKLLTIIKEIVDIIRSIITGLTELANLMRDCAESSQASLNKKRDGIPFDGDTRMVGYKIEQKSITFDFNSTATKIKGKAYLYKKNNNGNFKRDRKNYVGISFCAKEWNMCDNREWPSDAGSYIHPTFHKKRKASTEPMFHEPYALAIEKSWHYLLFKFYGLHQYVGGQNLFGTGGCD